MRPILVSSLAFLLTAVPAAAQVANRATIDLAIDAVYPSLVRISVVAIDHREGREVRIEGSGSGTIISPDGYVVTNHHVAGRAIRIVCTLADRREVAADLVGTDPLTDITVLKLRPREPGTFPVARFGDSSVLRRGDTVLAMGSPRALSQSVTLGVVSNTEMTMPDRASLSLDGEDVGSIVRWIGHDAAIYPGNSGGPLVNLAGEIVGINEISLGLSGAIPGNLAREVVEALIRDGYVRRSWPGFEIQPRVSGIDGPGALVSWVAAASPAEAAGLREGDVLQRVNDAPIDVQFAEQLPIANQVLVGMTVGVPATIAIRRGADEMTLSLTPAERPPASSARSELREWGLVAANLTPVEAREFGRATTAGVRVISTRNGGPADQAKPPLRRDDVIVEVDGLPIASLADLEAYTAEQREDLRGPMPLVTFERSREQHLTVVDLTARASQETPAAEALRAWIPIGVQVLTPPIADRLGLATRTGVRVTAVLDAALPLEVGDVILAVDDQEVRASVAPRDDDVFAATIRRAPIGEPLTLTVHRNGREQGVTVVPVATPPLAREMRRYDDDEFGFRSRDLADGDRRDPRIDGLSGGVLVESVTAGSWASLGRLAGGDVIVAIGGRPVTDVGDLARHLRDIKAARPDAVVLQVRRGVRSLFLDLQPAWR